MNSNRLQELLARRLSRGTARGGMLVRNKVWRVGIVTFADAAGCWILWAGGKEEAYWWTIQSSYGIYIVCRPNGDEP